MNVYPAMTRQVINITNLKWFAGVFILLFAVACGTTAPSQSPSSIPGASSTSLPTQETVVIQEAPIVAITPSPDHSQTDTLSGLRDLEVHSSGVEATTESVVSTLSPATPGTTLMILTPTQAVIQPDIPTRSVVSVPTAVVDQPVPTLTQAPTAPAFQDTEAELDERQSVSEITPITKAVPAPIEVPAAPTDVPTSVTVEEAIDPEETPSADGAAYRFVLPSATGGEVSLDDYLERGNVIMVFYRAFW